jgi:hypothetical protein
MVNSTERQGSKMRGGGGVGGRVSKEEKTKKKWKSLGVQDFSSTTKF